jgi:hypothetical protein
MLEEIRTIPYVPWHWGKNQKGMQAFEEQDTLVELDDVRWNVGDQELEWISQFMTNEKAWLSARDSAVEHAEAFMKAGYHKQIVNRLLEPFMWIDVVMTATDWQNFIWLRDHKDAEPHLQDWARLVIEALDSCSIQELSPGEWHLPYVTAEDLYQIDHEFNDGEHTVVEIARCVSAARCARVSYKLFDGSAPSIKGDLDLYRKLIGNARIHASPMEHQATPDQMVIASINLFEDSNETLTPDETLDTQKVYKYRNLHGNLTGWIQHRKLIPGERWTEALAA